MCRICVPKFHTKKWVMGLQTWDILHRKFEFSWENKKLQKKQQTLCFTLKLNVKGKYDGARLLKTTLTFTTFTLYFKVFKIIFLKGRKVRWHWVVMYNFQVSLLQIAPFKNLSESCLAKNYLFLTSNWDYEVKVMRIR